MKPHAFFSFGIIFTLLTLFPKNHTVTSTIPTDREPSKTEALAQVRSLLRTVTSEFELRDEDFQLITEDNVGIQLSGTASLFGARNVGMTITLGDALTSITSDFPAGAGNQMHVSGQAISDWLPGFLREKLNLTQLQMQFFPNEGNKLTLAATLTQPSGAALANFNGFAISQPELTFKLDRAANNTTTTASLGGKLRLGTLNFDLAAVANTNREWSFAGTLNELRVTDLVRSIGSYLELENLPQMPAPVEDFTIRQATLALNGDQTVRFTGASDIGGMEAYFARANKDFLLGFAPNTDYRLASISSVLQPIDALGLTDIALVYSATSGRLDQELELLNAMQLGSQSVKAGLTLMGGFELPADLPGLSQTGKVVMRATIPPSLSGAPALQAVMQFNGLQLGGDFRVNESFLQLAPMDMSFGAGMSLGAKLDGNWINFTGIGDIAAPATFGLVVFMEEGSIWKDPFGVKGVEIANLGLDIGADVLSPIPRPKLGVSGALKIGPFDGSGAGMLDTGNPTNSLISLKMNQIGMQEFVDAFTSAQVQREINKLPKQLRDFGLRDAELTIIPKTTEMAGRTYTQGLRVAGKANIVGLGARMDVNAGFDSGYKGLAAVAPIRVKSGNATIFELSGNNAQDSARMAVDLTYNNLLSLKNPFYLVDGKVSLLGVSSQTFVEIDKQGVYFATEGKIFDKFQAKLDARGGNFNEVKGFDVRVAMHNELIAYLNKQATGELDRLTKNSQEKYRKAKRDLQLAEKYLRETQAAVDAFNKQKRKVDDAQREVNQIRNNLNSAKRQCKKGNVFKCGEVAGIEAAYHSATLALKGYRETLKGLSKAVDWGQRNIAAETVKAARIVLNEFDKATTASMKAAKWIVDKGLGGIIDVRSAEFGGKLDVISGGNVSMKINVKFMGSGHHAAVAFNFSDPLSGAKALASTLNRGRASKGYRSEFGSQIGQKQFDRVPPPIAPTAPEATDAASVYQHYSYGGKAMGLQEGSYNMDELIANIGNDQLSSVRVQPGYRVTLYEHANFQGKKRIIEGDNAAVSDFNDLTSSIKVEPAPVVYGSDYNYFIEATHSGKYMTFFQTPFRGARLFQTELDAKSDWQKFYFEPVGNGYYYIKTRQGNLALGVAGGSKDRGAAIEPQFFSGEHHQQFWLEPASGSNYYHIVARHSGKVMDISGNSKADDAKVIQWDKHGGANQIFKIESQTRIVFRPEPPLQFPRN